MQGDNLSQFHEFDDNPGKPPEEARLLGSSCCALESDELASASAPYLQDSSTQIGVAVIAICMTSAPWFFLPFPELPLIFALGGAALIIAIKRPILVALVFVCLSLFRIHEAYSVLYPLRLPLLFAALTIAALAWHALLTRSLQPFWPFELRALAVFFVVVTLGIAFADSSSLAGNYWGTVFSKIVLMTIVIAWLLRESSDFESAARVVILSGVLLAIGAIQNNYAGVGLVELTRVTIGRDIKSILGDPNDLALTLLMPLSFSLAVVVHPSGPLNRALGFIAAPAILLAIVLTQSRGGLLGVLAVFGVFGLQLKSRLLFCLLLAVGAFGLYQVMGISGRISANAAAEGIDESALDRLRAWLGALDMALARPFTGVGLANFASSLPEYRAGRELAAHSTWLGVLGETGFPGFIAFVIMVGSTIRSAFRSRRAMELKRAPKIMRPFATGLLGAIAGFCTAGSFLTHGFSWPLYMIIGLTAALSEYVNRFPAFPLSSAANNRRPNGEKLGP